MDTFSVSLAFSAGNSPVIGEFPHRGQWRGALMFSLIYAWTNSWANNDDAGDLRRHRAHYDVIVMNKSVRSKQTVIVSVTGNNWSNKSMVSSWPYQQLSHTSMVVCWTKEQCTRISTLQVSAPYIYMWPYFLSLCLQMSWHRLGHSDD